MELKLKVGQSVFCTSFGYGEVIHVTSNHNVKVRFKSFFKTYGNGGFYYSSNILQSLFLSKKDAIKYLEAIPEPKKKIHISQWINVYSDGSSGGTHDHEYLADDGQMKNKRRIDCIHIDKTYEVD